MGLSCRGRRRGPNGRVSPEGRWAADLHRRSSSGGSCSSSPKGEKTLAEVSREFDIQPSVIREWKRRVEAGAIDRRRRQRGRRPRQRAARGAAADPRARAAAGHEADGDRDPGSGPGGRKKKSMVAQRVRAVTGHPVAAICRTLRHGPADGLLPARARPAGPLPRAMATPRSCSRSAPSPTAGPPTATGGSGRWSTGSFAPATTASASGGSCGCTGLMLAPRVHRRHGRPHLGQVQVPASNQRWCSDIFLIPCWSGEVALGGLRARLSRPRARWPGRPRRGR